MHLAGGRNILDDRKITDYHVTMIGYGKKPSLPSFTSLYGTGMVVCLERGANDLRMVQLMQLPPNHLLLQ